MFHSPVLMFFAHKTHKWLLSLLCAKSVNSTQGEKSVSLENCGIRFDEAQKDVTYQKCLWSILASSSELCCVNNVLPAGWGRGFFCSAQHWWGQSWSAECQPWASQGKEKGMYWTASCDGTHRWWWCISSAAKGWEWAWPRGGSGGVSSTGVSAWRNGAKKMEPGSFLWHP